MATNLSLAMDRTSVKKGESFNVTWSSTTPDSLVLVIDDGYSIQRIQVPDSGTRVCWSNRATKDIQISLVSVSGGKKETESKKVKVRGKSDKGNSPSGISRSQLMLEKLQAKLSVFKAQIGCIWASMKTWQRILWTALIALPIVMLIVSLIR